MLSENWLRQKHTFCHITLRDIDIPGFEISTLIERLQQLHIDTATLFAGGYVATYPTRLSWQRMCPGLDGRDLYGEIVTAADAAGIAIIPCIDIGEIPMKVARQRPELCALDAEGRPMEKSAVTALPCSLGPWIREHSALILDELIERYGIQSIKWAGASLGGTPVGCQCEYCKERYPQDTGKPLPDKDWKSNTEYVAWRNKIAQEGTDHLRTISAERNLTVVTNSIWHLGRSQKDIKATAESVDIAQIEVQSRFYHWMSGDRSQAGWERFDIPIESTRYVSGVSRNPPWVVASYFLAWPWRWSGVPAAEQFCYLAQVAANGGSPGVNFTTGAPHQHYDQRGMAALEGLFGIVQNHPEVYQDDTSAAQVALIYDHATATADLDAGRKTYQDELRGIEGVLDRSHVPYDIIRSDDFSSIDPNRHRACIIPGATHLSPEMAEFFLSLESSGIGGVWTGAPGTREPGTGQEGSAAWLSRVGVASIEERRFVMDLDEKAPPQAYMTITDPAHVLFQGIEAPVLAMADYFHPVAPTESAATPLARLDTFRLFPEGQSYPADPTPREPLAVVEGRQILFPMHLGLLAEKISHPDHARLLVNALAHVSSGSVRPLIQGKPGLRVSLRRTAAGSLACHVINATAHQRFFDEFTPLRDVKIRLPEQARSVRVVPGGARLDVTAEDGAVSFTVPEIESYSVFLLE